jgi:hypothetical protein
MKASSFERRKKAKLVFGVFAVGITVGALVGIVLFYMGRVHPSF